MVSSWVQRVGQRVHFLRRLRHLDGRERRHVAVGQLRLQPLQWSQAAAYAFVHQHAEHGAQDQQWEEHITHQLAGNALLRYQALGHLHPHALVGESIAKTQVDGGHAHGPAVHHHFVEHGLVVGGVQVRRAPGDFGVAQQEAAGRGGHHVGHAVVGVLFDDVARRTRKVHQQAGAHGLDLPCQRAHRLRERLVNGFLRIGQRHAECQHTTHEPQHQLGQQQPDQQLPLEREARRAAHGVSDSSM